MVRPKLVEHCFHPPFGLGEPVLIDGPVLEHQPDPLQRTAAVADDPGLISQGGEELAGDPQAGFIDRRVGDLAATAVSNRVQPSRRVRSRSPVSRSRTTDMAATQVWDLNGCAAVVMAAGQTHSRRSRTCWTWPTFAMISCSRRAPR